MCQSRSIQCPGNMSLCWCQVASLFWFHTAFWSHVANLALCAGLGWLEPAGHTRFMHVSVEPDGAGTARMHLGRWPQHFQRHVILLMHSPQLDAESRQFRGYSTGTPYSTLFQFSTLELKHFLIYCTVVETFCFSSRV